MEEKRLFLAWQDPTNRSWRPVGILALSQDRVFRFVYTEGARVSKDFVPFSGMEDLNSVYESDKLLPLFSNRLLSDSRPEYGNLLKWLNINGTERDSILLDMLAMTEGIRTTDTFEVFKCPVKNPTGKYEVDFFSHGLRYVTKRAVERVNSLGNRDRLFLALDEQNRNDKYAVALRTDDPVEFVGYCPRYLNRDFRKLLKKNKPMDVIVTVERVNTEAPLNLRLLCKLVAPWPDGFQPCSDETYKPLADYSYQVKHNTKTRTDAEVGLVSHYSLSGDLADAKRVKPGGIVNHLSSRRVLEDHERSMNNSHYGQRKEMKVARQLRGNGASVNISSGNRGSADLKVTFPSGKSWNV